MLYFKHSELAEAYHVSLKTIHNWISAAKQDRLKLELYEKGDRTYIANTPSNTIRLQQLAEEGKKYRNARHHHVVKPTKAFYDLYTPKQIYDIISNLKIHREIPRQYNYMDGGAVNWDVYAQRLSHEEDANMLKSSIGLLRDNRDFLCRLVEGQQRVNIIDIGPGNGLPVKNLVGYFVERSLLHRYIAIDISQQMLDIVEANMKAWYGSDVHYEGYVRDFTFERFDDIIVNDMLAREADRTVNLVLLMGGTLMNFREPYDALKVVYGSMGPNDFLIYTDKPDSEVARRYFNFNSRPGLSTLSPNHRFIFDLLNIPESLYDVEMGFNEEQRVRFIRVRLKVALTIQFKSKNIEQSVSLDKGDTILLWRFWHQTATEMISRFETVGFELMHANVTKDRQYLLTISGVSVKPEVES